MVGKDKSGQKLRELLTEQEIDTSDLLEDERICTIVETRIIARHQQVVRVDREQIIGSTAQVEQIFGSVLI
jgi:bifunctional ADP-heptose synthase (sugar kinase/adenylyltransferase)